MCCNPVRFCFLTSSVNFHSFIGCEVGGNAIGRRATGAMGGGAARPWARPAAPKATGKEDGPFSSEGRFLRNPFGRLLSEYEVESPAAIREVGADGPGIAGK